MLATKNPYIKSAYEHLQIISQDKKKRLEYEAREKAIRDHNQMMLEAEQRGIQKGRLEERMEIIFSMYQNGMPINQIASIMKIDIEKLKKMIANEDI